MKYLNRKIESDLLKASSQFPVVTLTGPRQTGKTTMLKKIFSGYTYISLDDPTERKIAIEDPLFFLTRNNKLLIDEIQYVPELLPYIKIIVDNERENKGRFILTGSQIFPLMEGLTESLAGRTALFELLGISFEEFYRKKIISREETFKYIFNGFYPDPLLHNVDRTLYYKSYLQTYIERDIRQITSVQDLKIFQDFIELLAARNGSLLNLNEISKECGVSFTSAKRWLSLLESTNILYLLRPYSKNITKRVIKSPKIYFTDTGLLSYILRYPTKEILSSGPQAGSIFENMIITEILKYKNNHNSLFELYFYRDSHHNEIDIILDFGYKTNLIEIKSSNTLKSEHLKPIRKIKNIFNDPKCYLLNFTDKINPVSDNITSLPWLELYQTILSPTAI